MYIVVKNFSDLKTPQPCHGKKLARLARECFANQQTLTVDFEGVEAITAGFFQELVLPLLAEFGAGFLKNNFQLANMTPEVDEVMKSAFRSRNEITLPINLVKAGYCSSTPHEMLPGEG